MSTAAAAAATILSFIEKSFSFLGIISIEKVFLIFLRLAYAYALNFHD